MWIMLQTNILFIREERSCVEVEEILENNINKTSLQGDRSYDHVH